MTNDGTTLLSILYTYFEKLVEAYVKVKTTNMMCAFDLYGVIAARRYAIESPTRMGMKKYK